MPRSPTQMRSAFRWRRVGFPERQLSFARRSLPFGRPLDADTAGLIQLAQIGDRSLSRSAIGSIGLDQRPVGVSFTVLPAVARTNEHRGDSTPTTGSFNPKGLHYNAFQTPRQSETASMPSPPSAKLSRFTKNHRKFDRTPPRKSQKNQFRSATVELGLVLTKPTAYGRGPEEVRTDPR